MFPQSKIGIYNSAPALFIEDKPVFPLIFMTTSDGLAKMQQYGFIGSHLYTSEFPLGWIGIEKYDFSAFESVCSDILKFDPDALLIPRVILDPPEEWMNKYPEELIAYADPSAWEDKSWGGPRKASWASARWKNDASVALRMLIRHIAQAYFANHIIGWHIGAGVFGEWHYPNPMHYPDTSEVFVKEFKEWLEKKYKNKEVVPRIPTIHERRTASHGMFRHPVTDRWMIDHAEFFHFLGAEALETFASVVKEETNGRCLVVAFNGYLPDLGTSHEADHSAFSVNLRSKNIDIFASPHSYRRRKPGEDATMRGFMGSVRTMGKLWINEGDDRTHLAKPSQFKHAETVNQSIELLWRQFAQALTHNAGVWFMDQGALWEKNPAFYFYNDPLMVKAFDEMILIAEQSMHKQRIRSSEIAVICDYKSAFYCSDPGFGGNTIRNTLYSETLAEIAKCGAPFDMYQITELFEKNVPPYKLYILLDIFYMNSETYKKFQQLTKNGSHLLSFYAPGYIDENGFRPDRLKFFCPDNIRISMESTKGSEPIPYFSIPGENGNLFQNSKCWYSPLPPLDSGSIREVLKSAGVHVYMNTNDTVLVGGGYIAIHNASAGKKTIKLPRKMSWKNLRTKETSSCPSFEIVFEAGSGETVLFEIFEN